MKKNVATKNNVYFIKEYKYINERFYIVFYTKPSRADIYLNSPHVKGSAATCGYQLVWLYRAIPESSPEE